VIARLVVASKNPDKIEEIEAVLRSVGLVDEIARGLEWPDVEESGSSLEENALLKARAVVEAVGLPAVADDTGLEVAALGGLPGVRTGRFAGPDATYHDNVMLLLRELDGVTDRRARFRTAMALVWPNDTELVVEGVLDGVIAERPRGSGGFGYDPVFEVEGRTLSEMGLGTKNTLSHRAQALQALAEALGAGAS
jgi:XTP/dITP diphosphohydrolase